MDLSEIFADSPVRQPVPDIESFLSLYIESSSECDDEDAEVVRVRLWHGRNSSAVVSDFGSADRVLANWDKCFGDSRVMFEVSYDDGVVIKGEHEFFRKGRRKCLFATWVQRIVRGGHASLDAVPA